MQWSPRLATKSVGRLLRRWTDDIREVAGKAGEEQDKTKKQGRILVRSMCRSGFLQAEEEQKHFCSLFRHRKLLLNKITHRRKLIYLILKYFYIIIKITHNFPKLYRN